MSRPRQTAQNYAIAVKNASVPPVQNEIDVKAYVEQHQFSHTWYKGTSASKEIKGKRKCESGPLRKKRKWQSLDI